MTGWSISPAAAPSWWRQQALGPVSGLPIHQVLAFHFGGDLISVLRQSDGDFRLVALSDCELVIFPADQFLDIAQADPAVLRSVLTRSLQALHRSRTRMMQMGHKSAQQRIADFLVSMAERLADCTAGACVFSLPMSRRDIGDSLGLTIETVSRQLTELREAGLVGNRGPVKSLPVRRGGACPDCWAAGRLGTAKTTPNLIWINNADTGGQLQAGQRRDNSSWNQS